MAEPSEAKTALSEEVNEPKVEEKDLITLEPITLKEQSLESPTKEEDNEEPLDSQTATATSTGEDVSNVGTTEQATELSTEDQGTATGGGELATEPSNEDQGTATGGGELATDLFSATEQVLDTEDPENEGTEQTPLLGQANQERVTSVTRIGRLCKISQRFGNCGYKSFGCGLLVIAGGTIVSKVFHDRNLIEDPYYKMVSDKIGLVLMVLSGFMVAMVLWWFFHWLVCEQARHRVRAPAPVQAAAPVPEGAGTEERDDAHAPVQAAAPVPEGAGTEERDDAHAPVQAAAPVPEGAGTEERDDAHAPVQAAAPVTEGAGTEERDDTDANDEASRQNEN